MDDSLKLFKEYFRDIYTANVGSCAGACNEATPASLGSATYEIRRCCKEACNDALISSLDECKEVFCVRRCQSESLVSRSQENVQTCIERCSVGCLNRFANEPTPPSHK